MSTQIRYQKGENVRTRAQGVSAQLYNNSEVNEIIERWSLNVHQITGRSTGTPYTSSDKQWETIRGFVLNGAAWEILQGMDDMADEARSAKQAMEMYMGWLTDKSGSSIAIVKRGFGLTDGLDASQYSIVDQV